MLCLAVPSVSAATSADTTVVAEKAGESEKLDVAGMMFGHIGDSYEWHICSTSSGHVSIPLPVIVRSSTGWHCFMSSRLHEGPVDGLFIADDGKYEGKIVEKGEDGSYIRPLDISITKNVASLIISSVLLVFLVLKASSWYRRHDAGEEVPSGVAGFMETFVMMVNDDIIRDAVGEDYRRYSPYLLTVFFFILLNNLLGLVPFFPGGANVTGNIAVTMVLALCTFIAVNFFGSKHYWKDILWPDVPVWMKFPIPLIQIIEIFGIFTKPFALMVRLFANIFAGHAMILGLVSVIFITATLGTVICGSMTLVTVLFGVFMNCLELLVAFIQAYVFTMLSSVFIGLSRQKN